MNDTRPRKWPSAKVLLILLAPPWLLIAYFAEDASQLIAGIIILTIFLLPMIYILHMVYRASQGERFEEVLPADVGEGTSKKVDAVELTKALFYIAGFLIVAYWFLFGRHYVGEPDYKVRASALAQEFQRDELAATAKYEGKVVQVSGTYTESGVALGAPWILLDAQRSLSGPIGVQCFFPNGKADEAARARKGSDVTLKGVSTGKAGFVSLRKCSIVAR